MYCNALRPFRQGKWDAGQNKLDLFLVKYCKKGIINPIVIEHVPKFNFLGFRLDKTMSRASQQSVMFIPHFRCDDAIGQQ